MSNKTQTVTFTLTGAQSLKWTPVLKSKEGIKTLTTALAELKKLKLYKEKQLGKQKGKKTLLSTIPASDSYKTAHWKQYRKQITDITTLAKSVYKAFPFSGKEHHYQAAFEEELREAGFHTQQEVARLLHYKKINGECIQLPHDIRGREDLLLQREKLILELKQVAKLTDKEFCQICRYMHERRTQSSWSTDTRGMLINFGDTSLEAWYLFYDKRTSRITRIQVTIDATCPFDTHVDTYIGSRTPLL